MIRLAHAYFRQRQPMSLVHFIARHCNSRCPHCFIDFSAPASAAGDLTVKEIEAFAARLGPALVNVNITGGEPFLNRDIWPICRAYYRTAGVSSVYITTHGGFSPRIEALLESFLAADIDAQLFISISLDDFGPAHDAKRRLHGLFARAMESYVVVKALNDARIGVGISITVGMEEARQ